jgi:hypothetical protein
MCNKKKEAEVVLGPWRIKLHNSTPCCFSYFQSSTMALASTCGTCGLYCLHPRCLWSLLRAPETPLASTSLNQKLLWPLLSVGTYFGLYLGLDIGNIVGNLLVDLPPLTDQLRGPTFRPLDPLRWSQSRGHGYKNGTKQWPRRRGPEPGFQSSCSIARVWGTAKRSTSMGLA